MMVGWLLNERKEREVLVYTIWLDYMQKKPTCIVAIIELLIKDVTLSDETLIKHDILI